MLGFTASESTARSFPALSPDFNIWNKTEMISRKAWGARRFFVPLSLQLRCIALAIQIWQTTQKPTNLTTNQRLFPPHPEGSGEAPKTRLNYGKALLSHRTEPVGRHEGLRQVFRLRKEPGDARHASNGRAHRTARLGHHWGRFYLITKCVIQLGKWNCFSFTLHDNMTITAIISIFFMLFLFWCKDH